MSKMTGARFMAETIHGYGITHVFFMPYIAPRALMEMEKLGIKRIQTHGEKAAAYMADAYARIKRSPSLCMAQSVGAVNLAAGLQDAYLACAPVIALTGRENQINQQRHAYQEVDHVNPFSAVTKYSAFVANPEQLPIYLRQAFRSATSGTPAPVHLDLEGLAGQMVVDYEADLEVIIEESFVQVPPFRPEAELEKVTETLRLLTQAKRPVIVAGGGVTASGARAELLELAEKLSIPVATSLNAKAMFPYDHPLAVGVPGLYSRACTNQAVCEADLVFFIGSHTGGQVTNGYQIPPQGTPIIQLDINPDELGRNYPIKVGMQGDVRNSLRRMIEHAETVKPRTHWINRLQELVKNWRESVNDVVNSDMVPMRPERLCKELTDYLPSDVILVSDTGHSGIWTGTIIDLKHSDQMFIRCSGSLGWGLPAAIGAKCAQPGRPVLCFTGDGGIWYHLSELDTAMKCGINVVILVNNNHSLNQEKGGVESVYGGQTPGSDELWLFPDADFAKMAESMGCFGITVHKPSELSGALDQAFAVGKPAVVDVKTHLEGIAPRAWTPA
ncbi:TPA: thiamine pyrophosphate-binding protein [Candidatus Poribacteria bacterium]|nr:thiamine pyrophosphate-binding protein [Candidatus Poribacteria bacterium]HIB88652.1 thiamine pyrophosphate-binding protein [Candidatus Poribacteria bacterium]